MRTRRSTFRPGKFGAVLAASVLLAPGAASAVGTDTGPPYLHYSGDNAVAAWSLDDSRSTSVMVVATDSRNQSDHGRPEIFEGVSVDVSQSYCDTTSNQYVAASRHGDTQTPVTIDKKFATASWPTTDVTMPGTEYRWNGCGEDIDWENPASVTPLTAYEVRIVGQFVATSELLRDNYAEGYDLGDGAQVVVVTVSAGRSATAAVDITTNDSKLSSLLPLAEPAFGVIGGTTRIEAFVRTCGSGAGSWPFCSRSAP